MSAAGFLRLKKLKGRGIVAAAAGHNRRAIQAEAGTSASIDAGRSSLNETLHGPATAGGVAELARGRMQEAGVGKLRKDAVMAVEIIFSLPPSTAIDDRAYFKDCAAWAAQNFGGLDNVLSVDIHRDEAAPHCHVLVLPLVGGKMAGSGLVGGRKHLLELHQNFHRQVAARYGLKKPPARLAGAAKLGAVSAVLGKLKHTSDGALRSAIWPAIRDAVEGDPGPFAAALGITINSQKKLRTMTQTFTSTGKGKRVEKPIGFPDAPRARTLSCVGFAASQEGEEHPVSLPATGATRPAPMAHAADETGDNEHAEKVEQYARTRASETTRVREVDLDPAHFDPESGEFIEPAGRPARTTKAAAAAWVAKMLSQ